MKKIEVNNKILNISKYFMFIVGIIGFAYSLTIMSGFSSMWKYIELFEENGKEIYDFYWKMISFNNTAFTLSLVMVIASSLYYFASRRKKEYGLLSYILGALNVVTKVVAGVFLTIKSISLLGDYSKIDFFPWETAPGSWSIIPSDYGYDVSDTFIILGVIVGIVILIVGLISGISLVIDFISSFSKKGVEHENISKINES